MRYNEDNYMIIEMLSIRKVDFETNLYHEFVKWEEKRHLNGLYSKPHIRGWWISEANSISKVFLDKLHFNGNDEYFLYFYRGNGHEQISDPREIKIEFFKYLNDRLSQVSINKAVLELA